MVGIWRHGRRGFSSLLQRWHRGRERWLPTQDSLWFWLRRGRRGLIYCTVSGCTEMDGTSLTSTIGLWVTPKSKPSSFSFSSQIFYFYLICVFWLGCVLEDCFVLYSVRVVGMFVFCCYCIFGISVEDRDFLFHYVYHYRCQWTIDKPFFYGAQLVWYFPGVEG